MIFIFIILILMLIFQFLFDHWSHNTVNWKVIFFTFQTLWPGLIALYISTVKKYIRHNNVKELPESIRIASLMIAIVFLTMSIVEMTYFNSDIQTYAMISSDPPAFKLTVIALILFTIYEIIMRWKKQSNSLGLK
jgi:hypothetical protein